MIDKLLELRDSAYILAARILNSPDEAEDVLHEAYLKALAVLPSRTGHADHRPWFLKIVANEAKNHLRSNARRKRREAAVGPMMASGRDDSRGQTIPALRGALASLDEKHRVAISLCYEQGFSQREAAAVMETAESSISKYLKDGLEKLRRALRGAGYPAAVAAVLGGLKQTAPAVPASLAGRVEALVAQGAMKTGAGAAALTSTVAAKGGLAMKAVAGVLVAGAVAGVVAVSTGLGGGEAPAVNDGKPVPVNPYTERQDREEIFEFTTKPAVEKEGGKWIITFASKGKCDATVTIVDGKGEIVRHLASGVLGKNAPWPFQQNSLSQKIEWDGQTDLRKPAPAGCKVKVALGLKAMFERNICYDPNDLAGGPSQKHRDGKSDIVVAEADGKIYAGAINGYGINSICRVFDKTGKYIKTVWPPPAAEWEKVAAAIGVKTATTIWGDKVPAVTAKFGPWYMSGSRKEEERVGLDSISPTFAKRLSQLTGVAGFKIQNTRHAAIPAGKDEALVGWLWGCKFLHLAVDPERDYLYAGAGKIVRFNGKTGEVDTGWFGGVMGDKYSEMSVGPDGLLYLRYGGSCNGYHMFRLDQETHKIVPFKSEYAVKDFSHFGKADRKGYHSVPKQLSPDYSVAPLGAVWCGNIGNSGCFQTGLNISPDGKIVTGLREVDTEWAKRQGHPEIKRGTGSYLSVYDLDGKLLGVNVVGDTGNGGHGVAIDRDGNVYAGFGAHMPGVAGDKRQAYDACRLDGVADDKIRDGSFGSIIKFRNHGGKYPLNTGPGAQAYYRYTSRPKEVPGALWVYGGLIGLTHGDCCCHHVRFEMDRYARMWIPAGHVAGIMVIDSNSNRIARFGRYGNVDDTEADIKAGKDGLRFVWPRAVIASESAMYVLDPHSRRILKAALSYHAEETVSLDGSSASAPPVRESPASASSPAPRPSVAAAQQDVPAAAPGPAAGTPSTAGSGPDLAVVCRGLWSLAVSYKRAGRKDKAREYFDRIVKQYPETEYAAKARREIARL